MAKSNLLKEAIADAKAVRETAIANARIALEEAFTPRLQSILSQKLQKEIEDDEDNSDFIEEEYGAEDAPTGDSTQIGAGKSADSGTNGKNPSGITTKPHTELDPETGKIGDKVGTEDDNVTVVKEVEGGDNDGDGVIDDPTGATVTEDENPFGDDQPEEDEFGSEERGEEELDLEAIIRELEGDLEGDDEDEFGTDEPTEDEFGGITPAGDEFGGDEAGMEEPVGDESGGEAPAEAEFGGEDDDDIDLDEILREMGYGDDEESMEEPTAEVPAEDYAEKEAELEEAYDVIRSLKGTINEVNLLNAKLLYSNKIFRSYELTNEQKMKVVETLDRTINVREVKLVFATLAESLKIGVTPKRTRTKITESFASNVVRSTAPKKQIITETNEMALRFQKLANIKPNKLNG